MDHGKEEYFGEDVQTVRFMWDEIPLTMELCEEHYDKLEKRVKVFVEKARRAEPPRRARRAAGNGQDVTHIREWAKAKGYQVGEKGRLPAEVMEAYEEAHTTRSDEEDDVDPDESFEDQEPEILTG